MADVEALINRAVRHATVRFREPVDLDEVRRVAAEMAGQGVGAFAVSGYAGAVNPEHELAVKAAIREETARRLEEALDQMDAIDREVLALRHFEELTNSEVAQVLGVDTTVAVDGEQLDRDLDEIAVIAFPSPADFCGDDVHR